MNKFELYMAIHEIDENLITEANDTVNIKTNVFLQKKTLSITIKTVAVLIVIVCTAICFKGISSLPSKNPTTLPIENTSYPIQQGTEHTETTLYVNDETTTTNDESVEKDVTDIDEDELTTGEVQQEESTTVKSQDKLPNYSLYTLSMWLNEPGVIWGSDTVKGGLIISEKTPMGTIKIADSLKEMFNGNDETTIYAVIVDFSSSINEEDVENWEFNGISISKLRNEFESKIETETLNSKDTIFEYKNNIRKIKAAYYKAKVEEFNGTFNDAGLKIYTNEKGVDTGSYYFYTFASESQIMSLTCKNTEAFVLAPASKLK